MIQDVFQDGTSFMDHLCFFCHVFVVHMCASVYLYRVVTCWALVYGV